jgi:lipid II isoglutaminyl synthase (glutamine-hydrolysing)
MRGLGIFDAWTIHKGANVPRCIGDIAIEWNGSTLVGFENHGGRTYLGTAKPLGKVLKGHGNNSEDHSEGAMYRNAFGTYLHGSLLPKNPHFADHLLALALRRSYELSDDDLKKIFPRYLSLEERSAQETREKKRAVKKNGASGAVNSIIPAPIDLDDSLEWEAHASMLERLGLRTAAGAALRHR